MLHRAAFAQRHSRALAQRTFFGFGKADAPPPVSLEGKVSDYLSCWDDGKVTVKAGDAAPVPAARAITIRDLLCHTAGIADYDEVAAQGAHLLPLSSDAAGAMPPTVTSLHEFATRLNALPLVHQPGSAFS